MLMTPSTRRSRSRRLLAVLTVGSLALAACSNSDDDDASSEDSAAPTEVETTEAPATTEGSDAGAETTAADTTAAETTAPASEGPDIGEFQPIEGVPGVTDEAINFAVLGTGPSNPLGYCLLECYLAGVEAYFDYRNDLGGVHGRELVVSRVEDDEVGNTQVKALELIEDDSIFGIFAAPLTYAGFADIGQSGVPLYTTFPAAPEANGFDNIYLPTGTGCLNCPRRLTVYTAVLAGATKVASLGFGVSQASKDCVANNEAAFAEWGADAGVEFVYKKDDLAFGLPNGLGPEVTAMKDLGVDFVTTCMDQNSVLTLEQELERQGLGDQVKVVLPQGYGDTEFLTANADLLEGNLLGVAYRPMEADAGGSVLPTMIEYLQASGSVTNDYAIQGWIGADIAVTGLLAAGPQFDRAGVIASTNEITDYTASGIVAPVDWSRQHDAPTPDDPVSNGPVQDCQAFLFVRGGELELSGDPAKPWVCFDPTVPGWLEPTAMTFE